MATLTRVHPVSTQYNVEFIGNIQFFTVDYQVDMSAKTGPESAQAAVYKAIHDTSTIIAIGALGNSNTEQTFAVEAIGGDNVIAANLDLMFDELGTVDGVDCTAFVTTLKDLYIAV
jgi:subtilase family serine protease